MISTFSTEPSLPPHDDDDDALDFPTDALPPSIRRLAIEGADAANIDPSMIAIPALTVAAAAIGNSSHCELKPGYSEPPVAWCAIVGASGCGKSPALDPVLAPVQRAQFEAVAAWRREYAAWEVDEEGDPPVCERMLTGDPTTESLIPLLSADPRGLLLYSDELAGWVKSFDGYRGGRGGDSQKWCSMHHARPVFSDRKGEGLRSAPMASVSVVGAITPGTLARTFANTEHTESGLLARLLLVRAPTVDPMWTDASASHSTQEAWSMCWSKLRALPMGLDASGCPLPVMWRLDAGAKRAFVQSHNELVQRASGADERTRAMLAKMRGYLARLALVIHLCRRADGEDADGVRIDEKSMSMAVRVVMWLTESAERIYRRADDDNGETTAKALDRALGHAGAQGVTPRELHKANRSRWPTPEAAADALEARLGDGVEIVPGDDSAGGRPTKRYRLAGVSG